MLYSGRGWGSFAVQFKLGKLLFPRIWQGIIIITAIYLVPISCYVYTILNSF